ncbi:hypothetical protein QVD17_01091 [Tagetes erecta]|uniref:C2H2-type domain-containing protein n=1 Tax=Tagetes erecta TaxID=13708 RepID=A0AAD8P169_TARER|nr:hypothetical protein QVD17_01091 [Tagetes erecta]
MDTQDHTTHSGHDGHSVHLCHRCGWPFPNPHPSAKHRRAHKKICGTIEGYTHLIGSEAVSDDEHHPDDGDKEKSPSPKVIDKKMSMESDGEVKGRLSRSEDEFADAVTEFPDSGTSTGSGNKALDRDLFFSFKDADTNEVSNAPIADAGQEVSEKTDPHLEKIEETEIKAVGDLSEKETNLELNGTGDLVKDGVAGHTTESSQTSETITKEANDSEITKTTPEAVAIVGGHHDNVKQEIKDSEISKMTPEVSANGGGYHDNVKQENFEKLESVTTDGVSEETKQEVKSDGEHVSEAVKESETAEEIKIEMSESDREVGPEVVKGSEMDHLWGTVEEIEHQKIESDHKHVPEAAKECEADQNVSVLNEKVDLSAPNDQIQEVVKEPVAVLTEKEDLDAPESEISSREPIQEVVKEPVAVLIKKEELGGPQLEKQSIEHTHEVVEKPDPVLTEKDLGTPELEGSSKEQIQEVVKEPATVSTEKEDLGGPHLKEQSNEHTYEVVEKPDSIFTEKQDLGAPELEKSTKVNIEEPDSVLTEKEDLGAYKAEECSKSEVVEQKVILDRNLVADISAETVTLKDSSDNSAINNKNASDAVPEPIVEEVLSTASIDAETLQSTEKSKVNSGKSNAATSDVFEPPSFMTLVEPESKDQKSCSAEAQPNSEPSQAGWFPTLTEVNNESEGRKKNEEAMAKVTNWNTGKQSTPLKNLLGEARSPSGKQPEPVVQKDEAAVNPPVNDEVSSPPKLIEDGKNGRKKVKGRSSWVPFVCCSSVNVK